MMVYNHIDIRFKPVLYLVATFRMVTQQNVVSNGNNQFLTCSMALVSFIGLIDVFEGLFIRMHHCTKLLIQPNSLRFKTVCSIMCKAQPIIARRRCFADQTSVCMVGILLMHEEWNYKHKPEKAHNLANWVFAPLLKSSSSQIKFY